MKQKKTLLLVLECILFAVFLVFFYAVLWIMTANRLDDRIEAGLERLKEIVRDTHKNAAADTENYVEMQKQIAELGIFYLEHNGSNKISDSTLQHLQKAFLAEGIYLLDGDGKVLKSAVTDELAFDFQDEFYSGLRSVTAEQPVSDLIWLLKDDNTEESWTFVSAYIAKDRYLVIRKDCADLLELQSDTVGWSVIYARDLSDWDAVQLVMTEDGTIVFASEEFDRSINTISDLGLSKNIIKDGWHGWLKLDGQNCFARVAYLDESKCYVFRAVTGKEVYHSACFVLVLSSLLVLILLGVMRRFTLLFFDGKLMKRMNRKGRQMTYARRMGGLLVFCMCVTIAGCCFSSVLCYYLAHSWSNHVKLEAIFDPLEKIDETQSSGRNLYYHYLQMQTGTIAELTLENPGFRSSEELKELAGIMGLNHILIYDETGTVIASDRNYNGLTLPEDKEDPNYVFRWLLYGEPFIINENEDDDFLHEKCLLAGSPVIADDGSYHGFVQIAYDPSVQKKLVASVSIKTILSTTDEENGTFTLAISKKDGIIYAAIENLNGMSAEAAGLTDREMKDAFSGFFNLPSGIHFGSCKEGQLFYIIIAFDVSRELPGNLLTGLLASLPCLGAEILFFLLLTVFARRESVAVAPSDEYSNLGRGMAQTRSLIHIYLSRALVIFSIVICILVFFKDQLFPSNSLMYYLININWPKGLDLFSFTLCVIYACIVAAAAFVIIHLLTLLGGLVPPTEKTVLRMLTSFIRYFALIAGIFICAGRLGAPTFSLLASAGILSVIVGLGAQNIFTDILAGLTILFEGTLKVGDVIKINNWRGQVLEIGVHNTSLIDLDDQNLKVISNSQIKSLTNYSRMPSNCFVFIGINRNENLSEIEAFLPDELAAIQSKLNHISGDILYVGEESITPDVVTMKFKVNCESKYYDQVHRKLVHELVAAFHRHGVQARSQ